MTVTKPQRSSRKVVSRNKYNYVFSQEVDFGAFTKEYFITDCGVRAGLIVMQDNKVLLVRQYRFLVDGLSWEIPGGRVDEAETPEESAQRECLEETGIDARNLKPLLRFQETLEAIYCPSHLFYTDEFETMIDFKPDPKEVAAIEWVPLEDCFRMIKEGTINDGFTLMALMAYKMFKGEAR